MMKVQVKTIGFLPVVDGQIVSHKPRPNKGLKAAAEKKERQKRKEALQQSLLEATFLTLKNLG